MTTRPRSIDPVFVILGAFAVAVMLYGASSYQGTQELHALKGNSEGPTEAERFIARYGMPRYSRNLEEPLIRDFFQDRRDGVFLDVGANHYKNQSNTYYLESELGWSGVAIEPLTEFAADYATHRKKTIFVAAFASDVADSTIPFYVPQVGQKLMSSSNPTFASLITTAVTETTVPTTTINAVLAQANIQAIDFMSMDIELAEPAALRGFDITRYRPALVCIEAHLVVRQAIIDYFTTHGYRVVGKYLRADARNLYFARDPIPEDNTPDQHEH